MKTMLLLLSVAILPSIAWASDEPPKPYGEVTPESVEQIMDAAEREFTEQTGRLPPRDDESAIASRIGRSSLGKPTERAPTSNQGGNETLLEGLAEQVRALKNRVVIERTTLLATQSPHKVRVNGAKTVFNFRDTAIYEVTSAVDHVTDIQLKTGESLSAPPTAGDTLRWNIAVMKSGVGSKEITHLILKPLDEDVETNLIITTDQRVYQLHLKSGSFHMPVVSWTYPEDFEAGVQSALKREESQESTVRPEELCFTYQIDGDDLRWKPLRVFDDGQKTFIQMPRELKTSEAPVLFALEDDSEPMLVNYRVKGDYYIVDRLLRRAELRVGALNHVTITFGDGRNWFERTFL